MGQKRVVSRKPPTPDIGKNAAKVNFVRIADIGVHRTEGPLCSLSFESERYGPHAYHKDDIAF